MSGLLTKGGGMKIIIDTREQTPWSFPKEIETIAGTLQAGDYSLKGFEKHIALERKSMPDFISCCGSERERFTAELQRLKAYSLRAVIIEGNFRDVVQGNYRSQIKPASVIGSISSWYMKYKTGFFFCDNPEAAATLTLSLMNNYIRNLKELVDNLKTITEE